MAKADGTSSSTGAAAAATGAANKPKNAALTKANGAAAIGSEAALKLKNLKGIHEDDGDHDDRDAGEQLPMDAQVMQRILASMGAERHDPRVVSQLQEFVHRYVTEILLDAQEYSAYADKQNLDADDIRLAIASRMNHNYAQLPSRELMMELADKRNSIPLPPISNEYGVRLPPMQYQLVTQESDRQDPKLTGANRDDFFAASEDLALDDDDSAFGVSRPPLHPSGEGSRNKRVARHQIAINLQRR